MAALTPFARRGRRGTGITASRLVASGLGTGYAPRGAGTVGSLAALLAGAGLMRLSAWALPAGIAAATAAGLWAIRREGAGDDPGWVVIDEVAGQWLSMLPLATPSPAGLLGAFALFRLFDIAKPGPVGWAERLPGAAGVMADDLVAGGIAAGLIWAARGRGWL